jgi:hypothetical protein
MSARAMADDLHEPWPELPWREWQPTIATVHMWTQIVGKVRMALAPPLNHWWHVPLYVSSRGLTTSPIPYGRRSFQVDFDLIAHRLLVTDDSGGSLSIALEPKSVATFNREFMEALRSLGIEVRIWSRPVEVADAIPFELDELHAAYDPGHAQALWHGLLQADRVMKAFQSGFVGKASPVHFFWGSFDLAAARYSGRPAPRHPGGAPNCPDWVMEEAYSREECSIGWWPSSEPPGPIFYAYTYPEPNGFPSAPIRPAGAAFDPRLGEFVLPYDVVRRSSQPDAAATEFFQSSYEAGADLGRWDRPGLEPARPPVRPTTRPWSTMDSLPTRTDPNGTLARPDSGTRIHRHGSRASRQPDG